MNTDDLKNWVISNNIEADTLNGFERAFLCYREDSKEEFMEHFKNFNEGNLSENFYQVSLSIVDWGETNSECIIAYMDIRYDDEDVGEYRRVYSLTGECIDDNLLIE